MCTCHRYRYIEIVGGRCAHVIGIVTLRLWAGRCALVIGIVTLRLWAGRCALVIGIVTLRLWGGVNVYQKTDRHMWDNIKMELRGMRSVAAIVLAD
jgi:hypothetical protein